jgi:hypothetical protein
MVPQKIPLPWLNWIIRILYLKIYSKNSQM